MICVSDVCGQERDIVLKILRKRKSLDAALKECCTQYFAESKIKFNLKFHCTLPLFIEHIQKAFSRKFEIPETKFHEMFG